MKASGRILLFLFLCSTQAIAFNSYAQSRVAPTISYQGRLLDHDSKPVEDPACPVHISLFTADDHREIWSDDFLPVVANGIFNIQLGSHRPLPKPSELDHDLNIGVSIKGGPMLISQMSAAPYALNVADSSITSAKLAADYVSSVTVDGERVTGKGGALNLTAGRGLQLKYDQQTEAVTIQIPEALSANGTGAGTVNTTNTCATNSDGRVGTNQVSGGCGNTIYSDAINKPFDYSVISGGQDNVITNQTTDGKNPDPEGTWWHTIGGGLRNAIITDIIGGNPAEQQYMGSSTIAGGQDDTLSGPWGFIGGGRKNYIASKIPVIDDDYGDKMVWNVIVGGDSNRITQFSKGSSIGGGQANHVGGGLVTSPADFATISGGRQNETLNWGATIGGGSGNIASGYQSTIAGGGSNAVRSNESMVGGGLENVVDGNSAKATIGGGYQNQLLYADYSSIAGGDRNKLQSDYSSTGGGSQNLITALSDYGTISGGKSNQIDTASWSVISGGWNNELHSDYTTEGGGYGNIVRKASQYGTIGGGFQNLIDSAEYAFIGGGRLNALQGFASAIAGGDSNRITNLFADHNFIGGGFDNVENNPSYGVIGGGFHNLVDVNAWASTIGGGGYDTIRASRGFIGGGWKNCIQQYDWFSAIGGGEANQVWAEHAFLGGGYNNMNHGAYSTLGGGHSDTLHSGYAVLGGGSHNFIDYSSDSSVLVGGASNYINWGTASFLGGGSTNAVLASFSVLGGGSNNRIEFGSPWSFIGGGDYNQITSSRSTIVGGFENNIEGTLSFIGGGDFNHVYDINSTKNVIGGGESNKLKVACWSVIGGGDHNTIWTEDVARAPNFGTIAGGSYNIIDTSSYSAIGGGSRNYISPDAWFASIPGGQDLMAVSYNQVVMGRYNVPKGTSTLGGTNGDDPLLIVGNGVNGSARSNAFEISNNGHAIAMQSNNNGGPPVYIGGHYNDNMTTAWGDIPLKTINGPISPVNDAFGVATVNRIAMGTYVVNLNLKDPDGNVLLLNHGAVTVTVQDDNPDAPICAFAVATRVAGSSFTIRIHSPATCGLVDAPFFFKVIGRQ